MLASRVLCRFWKNNSFNQCRLSQPSIGSSMLTLPTYKVSILGHSVRGFWSWFSSFESPQPSKETNQPTDKQETVEGKCNPSIEDLIKLVSEKEELLKLKEKEMNEMNKKLLQFPAEIDKLETAFNNTLQQAPLVKEAEVQKFAKNLLTVADNLGRASSAIKDTISRFDESKDTTGAVALMRLLLENVEETEKEFRDVLPSCTYAEDLCISSPVIVTGAKRVENYDPRRVEKYNSRRVEKYNPRKVEKYYPKPASTS